MLGGAQTDYTWAICKRCPSPRKIHPLAMNKPWPEGQVQGPHGPDPPSSLPLYRSHAQFWYIGISAKPMRPRTYLCGRVLAWWCPLGVSLMFPSKRNGEYTGPLYLFLISRHILVLYIDKDQSKMRCIYALQHDIRTAFQVFQKVSALTQQHYHFVAERNLNDKGELPWIPVEICTTHTRRPKK